MNEAKEKIKGLDLSVGKVSYKKDPHSLPNTVLSQTPAAGGEYKGRAVDLVISK